MSENLYEGMFLVESGRFATDPEGTANTITGMIEKSGGTLVAHRPWQDGRLAYPIAGQRKGLHYLTYFRMPGEGLKDLTRSCKLSDVVLRHLVISQPQTLFDAMVSALSGEPTATTADEDTSSPNDSPDDDDDSNDSDD